MVRICMRVTEGLHIIYINSKAMTSTTKQTNKRGCVSVVEYSLRIYSLESKRYARVVEYEIVKGPRFNPGHLHFFLDFWGELCMILEFWNFRDAKSLGGKDGRIGLDESGREGLTD